MASGSILGTPWAVILVVSALLDQGCPALQAIRGVREQPRRDSRVAACEKMAIWQPGIHARHWRVA